PGAPAAPAAPGALGPTAAAPPAPPAPPALLPPVVLTSMPLLPPVTVKTPLLVSWMVEPVPTVEMKMQSTAGSAQFAGLFTTTGIGEAMMLTTCAFADSPVSHVVPSNRAPMAGLSELR